jgi:hypothetical protein
MHETLPLDSEKVACAKAEAHTEFGELAELRSGFKASCTPRSDRNPSTSGCAIDLRARREHSA